MSRTTVSCLGGMEGDLPYGYGYLGTLDACDQWPIDLTVQNRFYFYRRICGAIANNLSVNI